MSYEKQAAAIAAAACLLIATPRAAQKDVAEESSRLQESVTVLHALSTGPDAQIPNHLLARADAIVVVPTLLKGGFVVGAKHGRGVMSTRDQKTQIWSTPAFVNMTGGSIGWQIGVEAVDLVLLVMNPDSIDELLSDKFTIGGSLSLAAGPVGRSGDAATDAKVTSQILAYSRAKGLFAGATFEGAALHGDAAANRAFYGKEMSLKDILMGPRVRTGLPSASKTWTDELAAVTRPAEKTERP